jgi:hypothetical protein
MRNSIFIFVLLLAISGLAQAQGRSRAQSQSDEERGMQVYAVAGLARLQINALGIALNDNKFQIGGGVDALVYKGLSVGGEFSRTTGGALTTPFNIFSANGSYHFLNGSKTSKFDPFATAGYSRLIGSNVVNFGGGMNYWLSKGFGVRFDFRDHLDSDGSIIGLRGGVVFGF